MPRICSTFTVLLLSDFCGLLLSLLAGFLLRFAADGALSLILYVKLAPVLLLCLGLYAALGLYPGILRPPSEELKRLTLGTSLGFLCLSLMLFLIQQGTVYSRFIILSGWFFALITVPLFRYLTRRLCANRAWWGYPVILFAPEETIAEAEQAFDKHRNKGLVVRKSVSLGRSGALPATAAELNLEPGQDISLDTSLGDLSRAYPGAMAFVAGEELCQAMRQELVVLLGRHFKQVLVHMDRHWVNQITLCVADAPGGQVLALRQNLLDPGRMRMKRVLDLVLCTLGSVVLLLVIPLIALCIRLESRGPVFFTQMRVGQGGRPFRVYKFRTMVVNAQEVLDEVLAENSALRKQWAREQKMTDDPRLTRVGNFLRRSSLDELPQVFNVIKGEMSLVGPRPIVENEIARYGDAFALYSRVKPGITGLWQVSGRNDVSYEKRVELDRHYVYNWSVWMDIYIIVRTIPALFSGRGAY